MSNKSSSNLLSLLLACISVFSTTAYSATIAVNQRDSTQTLSFTDALAFSDALQHTATVFSLSGNAGDTLTQNYTIPHGETNFQVTPTASFSVSPPSFTAGILNDTQNFTITANNAGSTGNVTVTQDLGVNVAPSGAINTLSNGVYGGYNYLEDIYNPTANQTLGSLFTFTAIIKGDYSATGNTTGSHQLININNTWTTTKDFIYDGTNTIFAAQISNYKPAINQIKLDYRIFGASTALTAVPVPATLWLFGSGLIGLTGLARKRIVA